MNSGEVFSAWLIQAVKWGFPFAALYGAVMTVLLILRDPTPTWDLGPAWLVIIGAGVAMMATMPVMGVGGVVAGLTAVVVTRIAIPIENERRFSIVLRVVVGIATAASVVVLAIGVMIEARVDPADVELSALVFWLTPLVVVVFLAVWFAGRRAVAKTLEFAS